MSGKGRGGETEGKLEGHRKVEMKNGGREEDRRGRRWKRKHNKGAGREEGKERKRGRVRMREG